MKTWWCLPLPSKDEKIEAQNVQWLCSDRVKWLDHKTITWLRCDFEFCVWGQACALLLKRMCPVGGDSLLLFTVFWPVFWEPANSRGLCSQIAWPWLLYRIVLCILQFFTKGVFRKTKQKEMAFYLLLSCHGYCSRRGSPSVQPRRGLLSVLTARKKKA